MKNVSEARLLLVVFRRLAATDHVGWNQTAANRRQKGRLTAAKAEIATSELFC
jgi:hypothetical protein